ncbi:MAG: TldD/PmbA family protein [Methanobrevibacter sp.]|uniref:TldD/PmbA family protein n=1 Tax=Methanobrevibacter sp. TaxID=66852 RepID=UPI0026DF6C42|nr:TldD/PmbA family protein [Methanobrevibacter sp.]MDO5848210.1 TldD/PmbA family protein [Methanobrevibacter sp.]
MLIDKGDDVVNEVSKIAEEYEIYMVQGKEIELESEKNRLNFAKEEISEGIGIRVIKDNKVGFAFTSDFSKIKETAEQALSNTKLNKEDKNIKFAMPEKQINVKNIYDKTFESLDIETAIDNLNNVIQQSEERGCEVTSSGFSANEIERVIINSNGVNSSLQKTLFSIGLSVNVIKGTDISTSYDSVVSTNYDNIKGDELSENVCNLALNSLGGNNIETDDYNVVLDYHAATGLLSTFISAFSSENVERGRSILKGKEGTQITTEALTLIDDGAYDGGIYSRPFDGEGTVSENTTLLENGVLNSFLYDITNANKANTKSTSNGSRSYASTPSVAPSNLIFNFKESVGINEIQKGVLVSSVLGAHTANPITGDFSVEANNAFKIENGEITTPIKKAMISGNIFELLKDCQKVESDIKQYGPYIIPKVLVHNLRVIGQN